MQKKIFVVDDDLDILEFIQELLREEGYSVAVTNKPEQILDELDDDKLPDLFLIDMLLSGKDGREIVKFLKNQQETGHIPVIMLSAHPNAEQTALAAGADDFVPKPFEIDELLARITHLLTLQTPCLEDETPSTFSNCMLSQRAYS